MPSTDTTPLMQMSPDQIEQTVIRLAAQQVDADPVSVTPQTHLFSDLNYDSLDITEFAMNIEEAFGIAVPDEAAAQVKTVQHALNLLHAARARG